MTVKYRRMVDVLEPGEVGEAKLDFFEVTEKGRELYRMRDLYNGTDEAEGMELGMHARLCVDGVLMMTDTEMEKRTNDRFINKARGDVMIAGLGMGVILYPLMDKPEVRHVTVFEKSHDVCELIAPMLRRTLPREGVLNIIPMDIFEMKPSGVAWDSIYFDIWPTISEDNWPEMQELHEKFAPYLRKGGYIESWRQEDCGERHDSVTEASVWLKEEKPELYEELLLEDKVFKV